MPEEWRQKIYWSPLTVACGHILISPAKWADLMKNSCVFCGQQWEIWMAGPKHSGVSLLSVQLKTRRATWLPHSVPFFLKKHRRESNWNTAARLQFPQSLTYSILFLPASNHSSHETRANKLDMNFSTIKSMIPVVMSYVSCLIGKIELSNL